ncbi:hypothetical protein [Duganella violaceipulchra]|uniref:DNA-binding protein YbaB n=1 Tax=Duganella violaceipulchra TaxID=2849652 RepID=A0AA41HBU0_9BURK|nr:hypothetical protein [Duganella violaceicalia]MBV6324389.1 hypothetical protein [Duganella violaceicalia]MCP2011992.1 DNA-binding protein YbaB [Duganella violaceicalia]
MKTTIAITFLAALLSVSHAGAADPHHPDPAQQEKKTPDATSAGMMENMQKMQRQMEKIQATTDPKERQKLMQEHMQAMQDNMKAMRAADASPASDKHQGKAGGGMMMRPDMMEKRMDMMQMMMEQMVQHQGVKEAAPASK